MILDGGSVSGRQSPNAIDNDVDCMLLHQGRTGLAGGEVAHASPKPNKLIPLASVNDQCSIRVLEFAVSLLYHWLL